jgi:NAD(P)-dependent dehydrogenase (short-subunit alcohol dehydrogenase family)
VSGLIDKRVLVVGASSGIGRGIAAALAKAGAQVAVAGRRRAALDELCAELPTTGLAVSCDVRRPDECDAVVAGTVEAFGGLDALVYAAGASRLAPLSRTDADAWHLILETNLVGASLVCRAALPHLRRSHGRAVFLGSSSVGRPFPGMCAYAASKVALDQMVIGWRAENPDISFSTVRVGRTLGTDFASEWDQNLAAEMMSFWADNGYRPEGAVMDVDDVAEVVCSVLAMPASVHTMDVNGTNPDAVPAIQ